MVANVLPREKEARRIPLEMLRPALLPNGGEPERRIVYCGISGEQFQQIMRLLGPRESRPGIRVYYLDGELELISDSLVYGFPERSIPAELLKPAPLADGTQPEERVTVGGFSWDQYLALDEFLGADRAEPRLYYHKGVLEIVTASKEHGRLTKAIGTFIDMFADARSIDGVLRGHATMREQMTEAGLEPDDSWCIGAEREFANLAVEIALTSGGTEKLSLYADLGVEEVWIWREDRLEIYTLRHNRSGYDGPGESRLLPGFPRVAAERCAQIKDSMLTMRRAFREALAH
jgi:Uma2 family endonuclease